MGLHWAHLAETFLAYACVQNIFTVYVARLGREASYSPWPAALAGLSAALAGTERCCIRTPPSHPY